MDEAITHRKERSDGANVPDCFVIETALSQRCEIAVFDFAAVAGKLDREGDHGVLARRERRFAVIGCQLVGDERVLCSDSQHRAVCNDAIQAIVNGGCGDHDHFALSFAEADILVHQCIVIIEKRTKLRRPVG